MQENVIYESTILNYCMWALVYSLFLSLPISYLTIETKCSKFELVVQSIYCFFQFIWQKSGEYIHCNT